MTAALHRPPSLDKLLDSDAMRALVEQHGRAPTLAVARAALEAWRAMATRAAFDAVAFETGCQATLQQQAALALRPVFNLTGIVLHTNLGRALLAARPSLRVVAVMRRPGQPGVRPGHRRARRPRRARRRAAAGAHRRRGRHRGQQQRRRGAAGAGRAGRAARRCIVSRGELVEIGGAFRMPDVMAAPARTLVEVGTTNRTHLERLRDAPSARAPRC